MLPKEHGAYGQLACPLVTALALSDLNAPSVLIAVAAVAAFLAHEPLLVLLGRRGPRARRETGRRAARWLAATGGLAAAAGSAAVWLTPPHVRWWFVFPAVPAAVLAAALWGNREKTGVGEVAAALTFSLVAVPAGVAGGAPPSVAVSVGIAFAALFSISTLGVRTVIVNVRKGGAPHQVRLTRRLVAVLTCGIVAGLSLAAQQGRLPWAPLLSIAPGLAVAVRLAWRPPAPARLRTVGWTLVLASAAAVVLLVALLKGSGGQGL